MRAIISDIHSNLEALQAVLAEIDNLATEGHQDDSDSLEILCLGDVVGYGPDPEEVIDLVEARCRFTLSGNHDYAVVTSPRYFNALAEEAVNYTRRVLKPGSLGLGRLGRLGGQGRKQARWEFLERLPTRIEEGDFLYVHGSPRDERNEYILESDVIFGGHAKIREIFEMTPWLLFVGHTHVPGIIGPDFGFWRPEENGAVFEIPSQGKFIINVGSVGQPRDGDNRACYVLADKERITYRRVAYDVGRTIEKMSRVGPISKEAAGRLDQGR